MPITISKVANPYKVTGTTETDTSISTDPHWIQGFTWADVTTATDKLSLTDKAGNEIWDITADRSGNHIQYYPLGLPVAGLNCDDMDSGKLLIYLKP